MLCRFAAVTIVAPRQCAKTTIAKALGGEYFDLLLSQQRWPPGALEQARGVTGTLPSGLKRVQGLPAEQIVIARVER